MSNKPLRPQVSHCRANMAELLTDTVEMTRKLEQKLDLTGGWEEAVAKFDLDSDPVATLRIQGALLLRKARIHTVAVLQANETGNLHSLAVQMRPVLECAGQVMFIFENSFIAPDLLMSREKALEIIGSRLNADFYQTLVRRVKGQISSKELRDMSIQAQADAAASVEAANPKRQKSWRLNQADKVANLDKGQEWYNYLSNHFTHGKLTDWNGSSWRGGVISINEIKDEFTFLELMSYLVGQLARLNATAALCPVDVDTSNQWDECIEPMLAQLRKVRESSKALMKTARIAVKGELDGSN